MVLFVVSAFGLGSHITMARPLQLEDLLAREGFGQVALTPDGKRLVLEEMGPMKAAPRFDYYQQNDMFRTRLLVADLGGGSVKALFPREKGVGYKLGPLSSDGRRVVVFRLKDDVLELGVADVAGRHVRWLGVTPEWAYAVHAVQWISPTDLVVIGRRFGDNPPVFREMHTQGPIPARWQAAAVGKLSSTVVGSGVFIAARTPSRPRKLLRISVTSGVKRTLAIGDFGDLEVSPSSRWVAVTRSAEDIPLDASHSVQGPYGVAVRRKRLSLIDLESGGIRDPCSACDVLDTLLSWAPRQDHLLVYARADGKTWRAGRLLEIDARTGAVVPHTEVDATVEHRPEVAYAGWWGDAPLVFGRRAGVGRDDWYWLAPTGAVNLTRSLPVPPKSGLEVGAQSLLMETQGSAWRIDRQGNATQIGSTGFAAPDPPRPNGPRDRSTWTVGWGDQLPGETGAPGQRFAVRLRADGSEADRVGLAAGDRLFAVGPKGALVDRRSGGGVEDLLWLGSDGNDHRLLRLNARFHDIDWPQAIAVPHRGPEGQALRSWLFLPRASARPGHPPPLVVCPYPGSNYAIDQSNAAFRATVLAPTALLVAHGYAVLMPSLPNPRISDGPADRLAERILSIVDAAASLPNLPGSFDATRLGLWGYSFGGYAALTVVGQTDRFSAAIAAAPITDLFSMEGTFNVPSRVSPEEGVAVPYQAGWTEDLQGGMHGPPWADSGRYLRNSPALHADKIHTPILLIHGDQDEIPLMQSEEMFSALYRQNKDALMVTYWGQPHAIGSPGDLRDYYARAFDWLSRYLLLGEPRGGSAVRPASPERASANAAPTLRSLRP